MKPTLDDRMKAIQSGSGPSMVPDAFVPPPPAEVLPDMSALMTDAKERLAVAKMIARHEQLGIILSTAKAERDKLTNALKPVMGKLKLSRAAWGEYKLSYFSTERSSLDQKKLLSAGVQPSIIAACTNTSTSYTLRISRGKDEEEV